MRPVLDGERVSLAVYWLEGYGGGLFLPFRDGPAGAATYGGGRYLLDTVKGADLGTVRRRRSSSTSTTPTTPRARTTRAGAAPSRHPRTACMFPSRPGSDGVRGDWARTLARSDP